MPLKDKSEESKLKRPHQRIKLNLDLANFPFFISKTSFFGIKELPSLQNAVGFLCLSNLRQSGVIKSSLGGSISLMNVSKVLTLQNLQFLISKIIMYLESSVRDKMRSSEVHYLNKRCY